MSISVTMLLPETKCTFFVWNNFAPCVYIYIYIHITCRARICTVYIPWTMFTGNLTLIMGYEFNSCGILQLKMQGWVGRVTLCIGDKFHGYERICHCKREGGIQQSNLLGFSIAVISWHCLAEPVWLHWWPGCSGHLIFGLDPFAVIWFQCSAWYSCQWIWNDSHSDFISVGFCAWHLDQLRGVYFHCCIFHCCSSRACWFRLIALTWL